LLIGLSLLFLDVIVLSFTGIAPRFTIDVHEGIVTEESLTVSAFETLVMPGLTTSLCEL